MATILYAEDDDGMRRFFEKALEKAGHHVIACADGDRAEGFEICGWGL